MDTKIKICGMRRQQDTEYIDLYRPEYAGFILTGGFRRSITAETFFELKGFLDNRIKAHCIVETCLDVAGSVWSCAVKV